MRIWKYEIVYHRNFYTCVKCTRMICHCSDGHRDGVWCLGRLGTVYVSRIDKSDKVHRGIQETGLGDASSNDANVVAYRTPKRARDTCDR